MHTVTGDLWDYAATCNIVVPTNLAGPMGRGVAKQAAIKFKGLQEWYRSELKLRPPFIQWDGLPVYRPDQQDMFQGNLIMFPVKDHWSERADIDIIALSLVHLQKTCRTGVPVALPLVGTGFGELREGDVRPLLEARLANFDETVLVLPQVKLVRERYARTLTPGVRADRRFRGQGL